MTNVEMDEVLSSIRRLVSEETKKKAQPAPANDRFVLTPAFRVADDAPSSVGQPDARPAPKPAPESASAPKPVPAAKSAKKSSPPLELARFFSRSSADGKKTAKNRENAPEEAPENTNPPVSPEFLAMERAWQEELARIKAARKDREHGEESPETAPAQQVSLEDRIAELEAAVGQAEEEWDPDGSEPQPEIAAHQRIFEVIENARPPASQETAPEQPGVTPLLGGHGEKEPENEEVGPVFTHSNRPFLLSNDAPEKPAPETAPTPVSQTPVSETPAQLVDDDDVYLDVDALRDMITDVVRDELRGRMGETITRNVRRMVRQEIERALLPPKGD